MAETILSVAHNPFYILCHSSDDTSDFNTPGNFKQVLPAHRLLGSHEYEIAVDSFHLNDGFFNLLDGELIELWMVNRIEKTSQKLGATIIPAGYYETVTQLVSLLNEKISLLYNHVEKCAEGPYKFMPKFKLFLDESGNYRISFNINHDKSHHNIYFTVTFTPKICRLLHLPLDAGNLHRQYEQEVIESLGFKTRKIEYPFKRILLYCNLTEKPLMEIPLTEIKSEPINILHHYTKINKNAKEIHFFFKNELKQTLFKTRGYSSVNIVFREYIDPNIRSPSEDES